MFVTSDVYPYNRHLSINCLPCAMFLTPDELIEDIGDKIRVRVRVKVSAWVRVKVRVRVRATVTVLIRVRLTRGAKVG